jgi:hypothetical protein
MAKLYQAPMPDTFAPLGWQKDGRESQAEPSGHLASKLQNLPDGCSLITFTRHLTIFAGKLPRGAITECRSIF